MNRGCGRESKGVCGALEGPWKVMVRLPEPLPTLLPRPDYGPVLWRPPKQQGLEVQSPLVPRTPLQFQTPAECAPPLPGRVGEAWAASQLCAQKLVGFLPSDCLVFMERRNLSHICLAQQVLSYNCLLHCLSIKNVSELV